jgi:hypothetical protein
LLLVHEVPISAGTIDTLRVVPPEALPGVGARLRTSAAEVVSVDADQVTAAREGMLLLGEEALTFGDLGSGCGCCTRVTTSRVRMWSRWWSDRGALIDLRSGLR